MAAIKKRGDSYLIRVYIGRDMNNNPIHKNTTYQPKAKTPKAIEKEVQRYADEFEKAVLSGNYLSGEDISFREFFMTWCRDIAPKKLGTRQQDEYKRNIEKTFLQLIGSRKMAKITALQLQEIETDLEAKGLSPATIVKYFRCLSSVFTSAYKLNIIHENPVKRMILPQMKYNPADIHYFDIEQARAFLRCLDSEFTIVHPETKVKRNNTKEYTLPTYTETIRIGTQYKAYFYLSLFGGFRRGELLALTWNDIDFEKNCVSITKSVSVTKADHRMVKDPKTKAGFRNIPLPSVCFDILSEWKAEQKGLCQKHGTAWEGKPLKQFDDNFIFTQVSGKPMNSNTPYHKFKEILSYYNATVSPDMQLPNITRL